MWDRFQHLSDSDENLDYTFVCHLDTRASLCICGLFMHQWKSDCFFLVVVKVHVLIVWMNQPCFEEVYYRCWLKWWEIQRGCARVIKVILLTSVHTCHFNLWISRHHCGNRVLSHSICGAYALPSKMKKIHKRLYCVMPDTKWSIYFYDLFFLEYLCSKMHISTPYTLQRNLFVEPTPYHLKWKNLANSAIISVIV